jgi:hypothetical protein
MTSQLTELLSLRKAVLVRQLSLLFLLVLVQQLLAPRQVAL